MREKDKKEYLDKYQDAKKKGIPFFPDALFKDAVVALGIFVILIVLSALVGAALCDRVDQSTEFDPEPEWYFLWVYQLLKEFPPHILGMEGPQACLLIVFVLMGIWALVPWLDRRSRKNLPSPVFSDLAFAAMFFLTFLTLKAWDIGVDDPSAADLACAHNPALDPSI